MGGCKALHIRYEVLLVILRCGRPPGFNHCSKEPRVTHSDKAEMWELHRHFLQVKRVIHPLTAYICKMRLMIRLLSGAQHWAVLEDVVLLPQGRGALDLAEGMCHSYVEHVHGICSRWQ